MTPDQKQLLMDAWVLRRSLIPVIALDDTGRGYEVVTTRELAEQRFQTIRQSWAVENDNRLHDRRVSRQALKNGDGE